MGTLASGLSRVGSADKIIRSHRLNRAGIQVLRTVAARAMYRACPARAEESVRDQVEELSRSGLVVWPDFLPPDAFDRLRREYLCLFKDHRPALRVSAQGPNALESAHVSSLAAEWIPEMLRCLEDRRLRAILEAAEKQTLGAMVHYAEVSRLTQGAEAGVVDPQTELHTDTFFNTHKLWLYLTDVHPEDAPLVYVRGSQRLTFTQIANIYRASCRQPPAGSRRVTPQELAQLGQPETVVTCRANTCVIANTCGYHRRLQGAPGHTRDVVEISIRANPFLAPVRAVRRRLQRPGPS